MKPDIFHSLNRLQQAYEVLSDSALRQKYDEELDGECTKEPTKVPPPKKPSQSTSTAKTKEKGGVKREAEKQAAKQSTPRRPIPPLVEVANVGEYDFEKGTGAWDEKAKNAKAAMGKKRQECVKGAARGAAKRSASGLACYIYCCMIGSPKMKASSKGEPNLENGYMKPDDMYPKGRSAAIFFVYRTITHPLMAIISL